MRPERGVAGAPLQVRRKLVKSSFGRPTPSTRRCLRSCVGSIAWSNLTHWLISTQAATASASFSSTAHRARSSSQKRW